MTLHSLSLHHKLPGVADLADKNNYEMTLGQAGTQWLGAMAAVRTVGDWGVADERGETWGAKGKAVTVTDSVEPEDPVRAREEPDD